MPFEAVIHKRNTQMKNISIYLPQSIELFIWAQVQAERTPSRCEWIRDAVLHALESYQQTTQNLSGYLKKVTSHETHPES